MLVDLRPNKKEKMFEWRNMKKKTKVCLITSQIYTAGFFTSVSLVILITLYRQELCPALIAILGVPRDEKNLISHHFMPGVDTDSQDHGRGTSSIGSGGGGPVKRRAANRIIYCVAVELVRLIGGVESLRPVLGSLFHRILLFPPPSQRNEALNVLKEVGGVRARCLDLESVHVAQTMAYLSTTTYFKGVTPISE